MPEPRCGRGRRRRSQLRPLDRAGVDRERAARRERAAADALREVGRRAVEADEARPGLDVRGRDRGEQALRVRVLGRAQHAPAGPCSTIRPAYMTAMSSAIRATTPMSCVISSSASPSRDCRSVSTSSTCVLHGRVERGGRLVGDQHARLARERAGDHRALEHPAGELVWVGVGSAHRVRQADELEELDRTRPPRLAREPRGVGDLRADTPQRVQSARRVLEDDADVAAEHGRRAVERQRAGRRRRSRRAGAGRAAPATSRSCLTRSPPRSPACARRRGATRRRSTACTTPFAGYRRTVRSSATSVMPAPPPVAARACAWTARAERGRARPARPRG